jgi:tetratricopeptide (TPR) repeat protein
MNLSYLVVVTSLSLAPRAMAAKSSLDPGLFQESYEQEAVGKNQEALAALEKLSPEKGSSYIAHLRKGWLHYRLGKNAAAIDAYTKAIATAPKAIEPRLGILLPLMADKQWPVVERHAREVLKLDPESYLGTLRLAFALYNQDKLAESRALYQKLVGEYPGDTEARSGLGWALLKLRKSKEAAAVFRALLDFSPKHTLAQQGLAAALGR